MTPRQVLVLAVALLAGCDGLLGSGAVGSGGTDGPRYHPEGYAAPDMHGVQMKQQTQDCRGCHGDDLNGFGAAPGCDGCHGGATPEAWRTNCTFCHGGKDNQTGAPPSNFDGTDDPGPFPGHTAHVSAASGLSAPFDCNQCHTKATDVLSPGHIFDSTPGEAENDFGAGLSPQAAFTPGSGCSTVYCHGTGRSDDGSVGLAVQAPMGCQSCHAGLGSGAVAWGAMSGAHALHLGVSGVTCGDCHQSVTADGVVLADASLHIDGKREVQFAQAGVSFDAGTQRCTGTCHSHGHSGQTWGGGGGGERYHPVGWDAPEMHGPEFELQRQDCRSCHGQNLDGGSAPSCDGCHTPQQPTAWRSDCVFCHGGTDNQTGAPPRDPGSAKGSAAARFAAHTAHVTGTMASPYDCTQCHTKPTDVLSPGHAIDATPGFGEVTMAAGQSPAGTYDGNGGCANLYCHGNGRQNGTAKDGTAATCSMCHAALNSGSAAWSLMSGDHRRHLGMGYTCAECHKNVTDDGKTIKNKGLHVNGARDVAFIASGFTYNAATRRCSGSCHGEGHNDTW